MVLNEVPTKCHAVSVTLKQACEGREAATAVHVLREEGSTEETAEAKLLGKSVSGQWE